MKDLSELTSHCIRCGFCLESCPTFMVSGDERHSPRGRIYLARSANEGLLPWVEAKDAFDGCLGCRACETACPSGVEYGEIFEETRAILEREKGSIPKRLLLKTLTTPKLLSLQTIGAGLLPSRRIPKPLSALLTKGRPEADVPKPQERSHWPPLKEEELPPVRGEVYLLQGCVMRVMYPRVQEATRRLLRRVGFVVRESSAGCCGALHVHNGYVGEAQAHARKLTQAMSRDLPVVVDAAGCGSVMKEYGDLIDDLRFANRVRDVSEFLLENGLSEQLKASLGLNITATYHDACHLAHAQKVRSEPRSLLADVPHLRLVPLPEADMCCGSAGIYNVLQPQMARALLNRKWQNIVETGATVVVMGNPGCHGWIEQAAREQGNQVVVLHTAELLEASFGGLEGIGIQHSPG